MQLSQGSLIAIEGIDGSGKSSLITALADYFKQTNIPCVITKEPGGSVLGQQLRTLLHDRPCEINAKAEYLLFAADRAQHFTEVIEPALAQKQLVISDRLGDSSLVYQGYGRGLDLETMKTINTWAMNTRKPQVTIYLHIDVDTAFARIKKRAEKLTAFEQEKRSFFEKLITGYTELYKHRTDVLTIDGTQTKEIMREEALSKIIPFIT